MNEDLRRFTTAVEEHLGIRVTDRAPAMTEILARRSRGGVATYLARVEAAEPTEMRALATEVSIGETYFFRHSEQCQAFAELIAAYGAARVLSAGCSSGEEPYTLAILARERAIPVEITAIDFNPVALARCAKARYSRWALRATSAAQEKRWFISHGKEVEVVPEIRRAVTFLEASLHSDGAWSQEVYDVIFCRNVTMYFNDERATAAIQRLVNALAPGGYLFLGHAETLRDRPFDLELCHSHGAFYYRKGGGRRIAKPVTDWVAQIEHATQRLRSLAVPEHVDPVADPLAAIRTMLEEERFAEATDALAQLPELDREGRLYTAIVDAHTGANARAEQTCRELLAVAPSEARAHYLLALCRGSAGDMLGAEHHAREALALEPRFAMAAIQLAFLMRKVGARAQAGEELVRAIALIAIEDPRRLALFSGGFSSSALIEMCKSELNRP